MDKDEMRVRLRQVVAACLTPGLDYTTKEVAQRMFGDKPEPGDIKKMANMGLALSLAKPGEGRPGTGPYRGKVVHPLVWRHKVTQEPESVPAYAIPPSQLTVADAAGSLARTYAPRDRHDSHGPASPVRHVDPELEAIQQRIRESAEKLKELEARINLLEMKDDKL